MQNIESTMEQFSSAIIEGQLAVLQDLLADELSYGHSDGHVEGKTEFISKIGNGNYQFLTMSPGKQTITEIGKIAIVRHELDARTNDEGIPGEAHLYVLLIWINEEGSWRLIARQAVKKMAKA